MNNEIVFQISKVVKFVINKPFKVSTKCKNDQNNFKRILENADIFTQEIAISMYIIMLALLWSVTILEMHEKDSKCTTLLYVHEGIYLEIIHNTQVKIYCLWIVIKQFEHECYQQLFVTNSEQSQHYAYLNIINTVPI